MPLRGATRTRSTRRPDLRIVVAAVAALVLVPSLAVAGPVGGQLLRLFAAVAATWFLVAGWRGAQGRERRVRGWIGLAVVVWTVSEIARLIAITAGGHALVADLSVLGLSFAALGTYVAAAHGRMRSVDETALYLDAIAVVFGVVVALLVIGSGVVADATGLGILAHAAFFAAVLAATLLLDLATRVPLRLVGPWEILIGLALGAVGYVSLLVPSAPSSVVAAANVVLASGALLVGHGGAHWHADEADASSRFQALAGSLRTLLPVGSALLTGGIGVLAITRPGLIEGPMRVGVGAAIGLVIVAAVARQTLLLVDRERVLGRARRLTDELTVAEAQYRSVVERVPGVVYVADVGQHGRWHFVSAKIEELLGYTAEEWMADATMWMSRMHPADRDRMIVAETESRERSEPVGRWEYRLIARDGRVVWVIDDEAVIARDADGRPTMVQGILVDISDRKGLEDQLRHQALHDPLTGLPNRVLFVDRLSHALVRRGRPDTGLAVLFVDLDDFKAINDTLGHAAGDELLKLVGERLAGVIRAEDTACRLGGDEFAFLLEDATATQAGEVAERALQALAAPFTIVGRTATLTASIGIASRDRLRIGDAAEVADELLRDADTAMYAAKSLGKGRVRLFDRRLEEPIARHRELRNALERAIETDELFLEYQPIVDLRTGLGFGVEALVRWNHPQLGRLMPADFVPLAEESGLIASLGEWVLEHAASDLATGTTLISVNVSAHQLGSAQLPGHVAAVLRRTGLPADRLLLELTESTLASAGAGAEAELQAIRSLGVRIAFDDFGSGYSSLEYLGRLPVDILKIDRSLVERVHLEPQRQEVLRAIGHIADKLELETIVEGVELEAQRTVLLDLGFRSAQGYLFAHALPLREAIARCEVRQAS